ncbi:MAG: GNAT family N-acetyltransferase [Gaiellaceae bacterium]
MLRGLSPLADRDALLALWARSFPASWPPLPAGLDLTRDGVVAELAGEPVGAVAVDPSGAILLLMVDPCAGRRGIGRRLHDAALEGLRRTAAAEIRLGSNGCPYLWPGVPRELTAAVAFFERVGWHWNSVVSDLSADLLGYQAPEGVVERPRRAGVELAVARPEEMQEVRAFERRSFPTWLHWFDRAQAHEVLVARGPDGTILGTLLFRGREPAYLLAPILGRDCGTIACVGVAEPAEGRGIGTAMVVRASELLRDAGTRICHISWTLRVDFYRRAGYEPWREYLTGRAPSHPAA